MRTGKVLIILSVTALLICFFSISANAAKQDILNERLTESGIYELYDSVDENTKEILETIGINDISTESIYSVSPKNVITALIDIISGKLTRPVKMMMILSIISIFASLTNSLTDNGNSSVFNTVFTLLTAVSVLVPATEAITLAASALKVISGFMISFIPVFVFLLTSSGNAASAINFNTLLFSLCQLITQFSNSFMLPVSGIYISFNIASTVNPVFPFRTVSKSVNRVITVLLTLAATIFVGILSLKGNIAANIDAVTVRSIKTVSGAVIPFVGSALGDAYASIVGSLQLINSTVGFLAILIIFSMIFPVTAELFLWYICFHFSSVIGEALGCKTSGLISSIASAISIINTLVIFVSAVFIISIGLMLKTRAIQ
jgi:stage III sporulation protein AE